MNWKQLKHFLQYVAQNNASKQTGLILKAVRNALQYNISILEFFQFRFFEKNHTEKLLWAGTGYMYEYQRTMNPPAARNILDDKRLFFKHYASCMVHQVADVDTLIQDPQAAIRLLSNPSGKIVFKGATGKCGAEVAIHSSSDYTAETLVNYLKSGPYDLVEEFIIQHPSLQNLSPSAVNTIRVFTQLNKMGEVDLLGCRLRISVNSSVDNMAAGNMAAPIDDKTGLVFGNGVYSDIAKDEEAHHPVTGVEIIGFQVPYWSGILELVTRAAKLHPENKSIGWDVVITAHGPGLIEGNHDWCKLLWQLPVKQGLKPMLVKYLD